jgi:hypothetical protein
MRCRSAWVLAVLALLSSAAWGDEIDTALAAVRAVGPKGAGGDEAAQAMQKLSRLDAIELPRLFAALDGANPLAANYLRASIEAVADHASAASEKLPVDALESYLADTKHNPAGRRLAYDLIVRGEADAPQRLLPQLLSDPNVELRRDAVAWKIAQAEKLEAKADQIAAYSAAFDAAVDDDQVKALSAKLKELGQVVDVSRHYGFLPKWYLIGPFDNKDEKGYPVPHGPEGKPLDLAAAFDGSHDAGQVKWKEFVTDHEYGKVDFNSAVGKHKGAIVYALAFFAADKAQPVEIRWNSKNACKLWLNDKLIDEREVYHQDGGPILDQYTAHGELRQGRNTILVKVCQNEQTDSWAQDWMLQLRVCDAAGGAVLSTDRAAAAGN